MGYQPEIQVTKGKTKIPYDKMQHRHLFVNSLLPHLKYPLRQHKFQTQAEASVGSLATGREPILVDKPNH
jgi:hypothetical protein